MGILRGEGARGFLAKAQSRKGDGARGFNTKSRRARRFFKRGMARGGFSQRVSARQKHSRQG